MTASAVLLDVLLGILVLRDDPLRGRQCLVAQEPDRDVVAQLETHGRVARGWLGVEVQAYLNGMAEAASELRRQVLDCLRLDENDDAERLFKVMDDVYGLMITVDYPDALTGGLRRTTDALRAVLERTRSDLTTALVAARVQRRIEARVAQDDS